MWYTDSSPSHFPSFGSSSEALHLGCLSKWIFEISPEGFGNVLSREPDYRESIYWPVFGNDPSRCHKSVPKFWPIRFGPIWKHNDIVSTWLHIIFKRWRQLLACLRVSLNGSFAVWRKSKTCITKCNWFEKQVWKTFRCQSNATSICRLINMSHASCIYLSRNTS